MAEFKSLKLGSPGGRGTETGRSPHLKAVFLLLVDGALAAQGRHELHGDERLARLLPQPAVREHASHRLHDVALGEAVADLCQAAYVQGVRDDPSVALNDVSPQDCCVGDGGKDREDRVTQGRRPDPRPRTKGPLVERGGPGAPAL